MVKANSEEKQNHEGIGRTPTFSSQEVARMTGVSLRQLQWWDEQGVVSPTQRGHRRIYQLEEVVEVSLISELRRKGMSLQKIRRVLRFLEKEMQNGLFRMVGSGEDVHLLTDGENLFLESTPQRIVALLTEAQKPMISVCVSAQINRLVSASGLKKPAQLEKLGAKSASSSAQAS